MHTQRHIYTFMYIYNWRRVSGILQKQIGITILITSLTLCCRSYLGLACVLYFPLGTVIMNFKILVVVLVDFHSHNCFNKWQKLIAGKACTFVFELFNDCLLCNFKDVKTQISIPYRKGMKEGGNSPQLYYSSANFWHFIQRNYCSHLQFVPSTIIPEHKRRW